MRVIDPQARLRALVRQHGAQKPVARLLGISDPYLSDLLRGRRSFSPAILAKLGLRRVVIADANREA